MFKRFTRWLATHLHSWILSNALTEPVKDLTPPGVRVAPETLDTFNRNSSNQFLAQLGSRVVVPREVTRYQPPPGVIPGALQLAADKAKDPLGLGYDDGQNAPQYSWLNQQYCGLGFPGYAYLSELAQRSEYRAPAEVLAKEMTRKFIKFTTKGDGDKSAKIAELESWYKKHDVRQKIRKALELDMFFGRAQIFINIDGDDAPEARGLPLVIDEKTIAKGSFKGFKVIEPIWTTPYFYNSIDPTRQDFYVPYAWYVLGQKIHSSRLITVISRPVPDVLKPSYNFGGISLTQLMEPYVIRWLKTVDSVNRLINNFSVLYLATNMQTVLQGDAVAGQGLMDRMRMFVSTRDNQGLMTLDKDTEELAQVAVPLSGLDELQAQAQEHMAAPSHIPLVKLTGITPSGLNASSEGEIQVFYDFVMSENETVAEPVLDVILDIAQLDLYGTIDEDIDYEFVPLTEPTRKEVAEMAKSKTDGIVSLVGAGVIDAEEGREVLMNDPDSGFNNLTGPAPEPEQEEFERNEEGAENAHERSEESAENAHERSEESAERDSSRGNSKED